MTSVIGVSTKGDSNSFDGGETVSTGEERRLDGALFSDAPKGTNVELFCDLNEPKLLPNRSIWTRFLIKDSGHKEHQDIVDGRNNSIDPVHE